jgi:hypothetical protein
VEKKNEADTLVSGGGGALRQAARRVSEAVLPERGLGLRHPTAAQPIVIIIDAAAVDCIIPRLQL